VKPSAIAVLVLAVLVLAVVLVVSSLTGASLGTTERVSVDSAGNQGNDRSNGAAISSDGRYVAFGSSASNLVPGDTSHAGDVFVHDRQTGITERVSVDSAGNQGNNSSGFSAISADGRYVAFDSHASNLVPDDTNECGSPDHPNNCDDIFVHDRQTGVTERVSMNSVGNQGNDDSSFAAISADGRYVAFLSYATNLVVGDTNAARDVFVHDRQTGATTRVSVDSGGNEGNGQSYIPAISADGRYVAFDSLASNLVPGDTNDGWDVFVHDRQTGGTTRVSVDSAGNEGNDYSGSPAITPDGRYVAFNSSASNLVPGDTNDGGDVFVHDRQTGVTERVSVDSAGNQGNGWSYEAAISAGGRYVAFVSSASNLVPGDTNGDADIFVHDRDTDADGIFDEPGAIATERVSGASNGRQGNGYSSSPAVSADGRYVAFESCASNLLEEDTNWATDVFVHDRAGEPPTPTPVAPPANDDFADAQVIDSVPGMPEWYKHEVDTSQATLQPGEPRPCGSIGATVWYEYTPATTDWLAAETWGHWMSCMGSDFDTVLAVYTGTSLDDLTLVECNDDLAVEFEAVAATTYYFQVGGSSGATGTLRFHLSDWCMPVPYTTYQGEVLIDGAPAPDGTSIVALIEGTEWGRTSTSGGSYVVNVPSSLPGTPPCFWGGRIHFYANGLACVPTVSWGGAPPIDLDLVCGNDSDGDGFYDAVEAYLGTDPLDNCPDSPTDDAWPLDIDMNGDLSVTGDVFNYIGRIGATPSSPNWWGRLDFDMDGSLSVTGDVFLYIHRIGEKCT